MHLDKDLFLQLAKKFSYPEGRYNYFPRIQNWENNLSLSSWKNHLQELSGSEIDLYIHIPFCNRFCFFCGCNIQVAKTQDQISHYINELIIEWNHFYKSHNFKINNVHIGGGTPNALNPSHIEKLLSHFKQDFKLHIEYDPRYHDHERLMTFNQFGLSTISAGIQDFSDKTLSNIGRETNFNDVQKCFDDLKNLNLNHLSIDLIYGLPFQTENSAKLAKNFLDHNDHITGVSLYPFAEVPWFKDFNPLPSKSREEKNERHFDFANTLSSSDFELISFGHYVKTHSAFHASFQEQKLNRTIMGFCTNKSPTLIGLGVSAISSTPKILKQNQKIYENYLKWNNDHIIGHIRSPEEQELEKNYLNISTSPYVQHETTERHFLAYDIRQF